MSSIAAAVSNAIFRSFQTNSAEPQLVANLVWQLPHHINQIKFRGPSKISAGGVFVHARPFVTCDSFPKIKPKSVEIGDLLFIRTLVEKNVVVERRALLLQAKKVNRVPKKPDNDNQWYLYERWPAFKYELRSGGLTGKSRHINEPDMYEAAKYLLIGNGSFASPWHCTCCMGCPFHWHHPRLKSCFHYTAQPTKPEISRYRCFVDELVSFIAGNAGKVFAKPKPRTRGWDRVIHDLIAETAKAKTIYAGRATGQSTSAMRGNGVLFYSFTGQSNFSFFGGDDDRVVNNSDEPPDVPNEWNDDYDGGGISIIEFAVEHGEG
jgi:hypothetical protein